MNDKQPTTVYAVHYDYYEDSRTVAVFTDRAIAEAHAAELGADYEVEAYDLVDHAPVKAAIFTESGIVQPDGSVSHRRSSSREDWDYAYMSGAVWASTSTSGGVDRVHLQAQSPLQAMGDAALAAAVAEVNRRRTEGPWPVERGLLALPTPDDEYSFKIDTESVSPSTRAMIATITGGGLRTSEVRAQFDGEPGPAKRTPEDWCREYDLAVADPDGWRRPYALSWDEPITLPDFWRRYGLSTARMVSDEAASARIAADLKLAREQVAEGE